MLHAVVGLLLVAWSTDAFVPQQTASRARSALGSVDETKEVEKALRQELEERNSKVEDEEKYAVADGTGMDTEKESPSTTTADDAKDTSEDVKMLERLVKKRPYALFLAEKGVEIIEDTLDGLLNKKNSESDFVVDSDSQGEKEKVVVLGTGWGAAAFLKGIDTSQYDVTVISPRNYFVFTPMLAGASVGTVDYRSITEPIREVRNVEMTQWRDSVILVHKSLCLTICIFFLDQPQSRISRGGGHRSGPGE